LSPIGQVIFGDGLPVFVTEGAERRFPRGSYSHF
jgi:hypothetical protein